MSSPRSRVAAAALSALCLATASVNAATVYTWQPLASGDASGSWATSTNWSPTGPAVGTSNSAGNDNTADFSTQDITVDSVVTLDGNQTINHLKFGDATPSSAAGWTINPGSPSNSTLTLSIVSGGGAANSPRITVNALGAGKSATISAVIAGTDGLTKVGSGTLVLSSAGNTYSGSTTIEDGVISINNANQISNTSTFLTFTGASTGLHANGAISLPSNKTITLTTPTVPVSTNTTITGTSVTVNGALTRGGGNGQTVTLTNNTTGGITLAGAVNLSDAAAISKTLTLAGNATSVTTITGVVANAATSGAGLGGLTINAATGGVVILGNNNTYTGTTTVTSGTLLVNGSTTASSTVNVTGGTLGGTGTVNGAVNITGGTLAPGASAGTLNTGAVTLGSTSILSYELNAADDTIGSLINDLTSVAGNLTLDGTLNVSVLGGSELAGGNVYRLFNYTGGLSDLGLSLGAIAVQDGYEAQVDTATTGQVNLAIVPIPEPAGLAVLAIGMLGVATRRRRSSCC